MRFFFIILLISSATNFFGQSFSGIITDKKTDQPLQYATVFNISSKIGTVTNEKGRFLLQNAHQGDTISISYIGHQKMAIILSTTTEKKIQLAPKDEILKEVTVLADNEYLYDLISKIRKKYLFENAIQLDSDKKTAKTYYQLETFYNEKRVELTEAYFNGIFSPYAIEELHLKKGRAGLKAIDSSLMINSETSKAFRNHSLFYNNEGFPENPFSLSKRKLRKKYQLSLISVFKENNQKIFVIQYQSENKEDALFNGKIWINTNAETIKRIELQRNESKRHPFLPYGNIERIDKADLFLAKEFVAIKEKNYVSSVDFYYNLYCAYSGNKTKKYHTKAFIKAYDYNTKFALPSFNFTNSIHQDIKDISASIYDSAFWNNAKEFAINVGNEKKSKFIESHSMQIKKLPLRRIKKKHNIFEHMYRHWQPERLPIGDLIPSGKKTYQHVKDKAIFEYNIEASIYMDMHTSGRKTTVLLNTVLNPQCTFVDRKMTNNIRAFINMYFDIIEIEKRKLAKAIKAERQVNIEKLHMLYEKQTEAMKRTLAEFSKDVFHGTNKEGMFKWNAYIIDNLDVDNIAAFELFEEEMSTQIAN